MIEMARLNTVLSASEACTTKINPVIDILKSMAFLIQNSDFSRMVQCSAMRRRARKVSRTLEVDIRQKAGLWSHIV